VLLFTGAVHTNYGRCVRGLAPLKWYVEHCDKDGRDVPSSRTCTTHARSVRHRSSVHCIYMPVAGRPAGVSSSFVHTCIIQRPPYNTATPTIISDDVFCVIWVWAEWHTTSVNQAPLLLHVARMHDGDSALCDLYKASWHCSGHSEQPTRPTEMCPSDILGHVHVYDSSTESNSWTANVTGLLFTPLPLICLSICLLTQKHQRIFVNFEEQVDRGPEKSSVDHECQPVHIRDIS